MIQDTAYYMHHMSMLVGSYSVIVVGNYLVGFILLIVVYWKILRLIKKMKAQHSKTISVTLLPISVTLLLSISSPFVDFYLSSKVAFGLAIIE